MGQNKYLVFILGLIVLIVWVSVFVRIKKISSDNKSTNENAYSNEGVQISSVNEINERKLFLDYPDPFRGNDKFFKKKESESGENSNLFVGKASASNLVSQVTSFAISGEVLESEIRYFGCIHNGESMSRIGFLEYNGKKMMIIEGEMIQQSVVKKITSDSLVLEFKRRMRVVPIYAKGIGKKLN